MTFHPFGDQALLINFEQKIDEAIHDKVLNYYNAIQDKKIAGIRYCIPAYCSLTLAYNSKVTNFETLKKAIEKLKISNKKPAQTGITKVVPVCFDESFAIDMREVELFSRLAQKEIIETFCNTTYRVYMIGFLPGFPYLGKLPAALKCPRRYIPRKRVPANSVAIAGEQAGIYPCSSPGGWQIIGKTPKPIFDVRKENPILFSVGDQVQFEPISKPEFNKLESQRGKRMFSNL